MKKGNMTLAGVFSLLAILVIIQSSFYPKGQDGIPGPGFFPIIIAVLMLAASISLIITTLRMLPEEDVPLGLSSLDNKRAYAAMGIMVLYVIVMPVLGFCVTSFLLLFGMIKWLSDYKYIVCCGASAGVIGMIYVVFSVVLHVSLSFGLLF
ncbi:tripartite tricarboxylate transporter TctB family protein [Lacrimispora sp. 210928-DFI.3.58]|uniref:tripartite tricarboxylate transporter TctB family protein n=1 Tax=Lacrimispora sp. 210928-DFI.3.58 TaxID=2883214 RepID=UPI0015B50C8E|nr:tripartite tricarboxylate transporter TctB family protein [Lacrimispora sp. 210928-DFI.3.58]MCB7318848.1 tripartite tricarboxylate transporter TctB family protein [Lacrimispora sp. 210928-DFI.3.58]